MASEYLKWKARDEKPAPPLRELTKKEKFLNWLHYHKLWLIAGAVLLWIVGTMLWNILGIGQVKPDYVVAYIGKNELSEEAALSLTDALATLGEDVNGDGKTVVELRQYATASSGDTETALRYAYAADARLLADMTAGDSCIFLMEDPDAVQRAYHLLAQWDGTPPEEDDYDASDKVILWSDCPTLQPMAVEEDISRLYLGRRCFYDDKLAAKHSHNEALWNMLTMGVQP